MKRSRLSVLNVASFVLSIYVIAILVLESFVKLPTDTIKFLMKVDHIVCVFFFCEFCIRFYKAENKWKFMKWGWLDLLACIPVLEQFRNVQGLKLLRLIRVIRAYRSVKYMIEHVASGSKSGALVSLSIAAFLIIVFSAVGVLEFELGHDGNIKTAEDALWWAMTTITTVGYGDRFPVTTGGRVVGSFLMVCGVGIFGTFAALVGTWFTAQKEVLTSKLLISFIKWYQVYLYEESKGEDIDSMADVLEKLTPEELVEKWSYENQNLL